MALGEYTYVWEFIIYPKQRTEFEHHYHSAGTWVMLFRKGVGYLRSELYQDSADPSRYLTVDHWISKEAYDKFRTEFTAEFETIDKHCEQFIERERLMGTFTEPRI